jgi:hypothetical protein
LESQNASFDRNDGRDMRLPFGPGDRRPGIEHGNGAGFVAVALFAVNRLNCDSGLVSLQTVSTLRHKVG